jgi:hypothetical protein
MWKNKVNPSKSPKLELIFQNFNSWNFRPRLIQEGQFPTNLIINPRKFWKLIWIWMMNKISVGLIQYGQ